MLGKSAGQLWDEMVNPAPLEIELDYSGARDLANFAEQTRETLLDWYPYFAQELDSPDFIPISYIKLTIDPNYDGVAYAAGNQIVGGAEYYRSHQDDFGSMIHEMIHVIQGYRSGPGWLVEGIADYWRNYHFEDDSKPKPSKPGPNNKYTDGYKVTAFFLDYVDRTNPARDMLYWLNKDCREGTYADTIWPRLLNGKTVDVLWDEMMELA
ncbi:unnamed protein product [Allacma fusca]|uniref:Plant Basic Secretory Protein n=1 Tax=Allacma fusca TaxID=39272 RepID=A0A8J2JCK9_9HEXA|nr:unnamed protein product [Allacma fusca]